MMLYFNIGAILVLILSMKFNFPKIYMTKSYFNLIQDLNEALRLLYNIVIILFIGILVNLIILHFLM